MGRLDEGLSPLHDTQTDKRDVMQGQDINVLAGETSPFHLAVYADGLTGNKGARFPTMRHCLAAPLLFAAPQSAPLLL